MFHAYGQIKSITRPTAQKTTTNFEIHTVDAQTITSEDEESGEHQEERGYRVVWGSVRG
jgi:hypothetical protein